MHESDWFTGAETDDGQKYDWLIENLSGNYDIVRIIHRLYIYYYDSVPVALQAKALSQNLFYKSSPKIALRTKALQPNAIQPLSKSHPPKALRPIALQIKSFW